MALASESSAGPLQMVLFSIKIDALALQAVHSYS